MSDNKSSEKVQKKEKSSLIRRIIVLLFFIIFILANVISLRGRYLAIKEINPDYLEIFFKNLKVEYSIFGIVFLIVFVFFFITTLFIKKGLKPFFDDDKLEVPKLPNKSISFIIAVIVGFIAKKVLLDQYMLFSNASWFGINDPVFNNDIGYYMFILPFIKNIIFYSIGMVIFNLVYVAVYNVIVFNVFLNGVERNLLKKSIFLKQVVFNSLVIVLLFSSYIWTNTENILTGNLINIKNTEKTSLIGAGSTDITVKFVGYRALAVLIFLVALRLVRCIKKANFKQGAITVLSIPVYLIGLFCIMIYSDYVYMGSNELDKQKSYIGYNIDYTKKAYGIDIEQVDLENYDTISNTQVEENREFLENIPLITQDVVKQALEQSQEDSMYYSYNDSRLAYYNVDGQKRIVYLTPKEIITQNRSYNNLTYEYTHGYSAVISSASQIDKNGYPIIFNQDNSLIKEPRIYFGNQDSSEIIVNSDYGNEYDYLKSANEKLENNYIGNAGLNLDFWDRLVVGIRTNNIKLAFSKYINENSKIITNRNVLDRVKTIMPELTYDEPYMVISDEGKLVWVIDGYTTSKEYPYSQYVTNSDGEKINYIRNSVKVLVDSYDGTVKFYITDKTDPIIKAYQNLYPKIFVNENEEIPSDIAKHLTYPKLLFDLQSEMINLYHGTSEDVLYRGDNVWQVSTENTNKSLKVKSYFTLVNTIDENEPTLGLMVPYNKYGKQSMTAYLLGISSNGTNKLTLYKFDSNNNIAGISQVNNQIDQDENISKELEKLNTTGTKLIRSMEIVPIDNTLLYVEKVYQILLNDADSIPTLKKVIVASGNVLAMGDTLEQAVYNLNSDYSIELDFYDAEDMDALITSIIKANNNLNESMNSNDFEMIGKDLGSLQNLLEQLEVLYKKNKITKDTKTKEQNVVTENSDSIIDEVKSVIQNGVNKETKVQ